MLPPAMGTNVPQLKAPFAAQIIAISTRKRAKKGDHQPSMPLAQALTRMAAAEIIGEKSWSGRPSMQGAYY
jgi:hypothetical protein